MRQSIQSPKFKLGQTVATPALLAAVDQADITAALFRHERGDWGQVSPADREQNELALTGGARLMSVYTSAKGTTFWVITEADRSSTCVLLPSEY